MNQLKNNIFKTKVNKVLPYWLILCCFISFSFSSLNAASTIQNEVFDSVLDLATISQENKTSSQKDVAHASTIEKFEFEFDTEEEDEYDKQTFYSSSLDSNETIIVFLAKTVNHLRFIAPKNKLFILYHCWKDFLI